MHTWLTVYYTVLYLSLLQRQCIILGELLEDDALALKHVKGKVFPLQARCVPEGG